MTFVIINPVDKTVSICDKTIRVYPINNFTQIQKELKDKEVSYVTEFVDTTGEEVLNIIEELFLDDYVGDQTGLENTELYLHVNNKGNYFVKHENKNYYFSGMYDFKNLKDLPENFVTDCQTISDGIRTGIFRIIDEEQKNEIEQKNKKIPVKKKQPTDSNSKGSLEDPIEIDIGRKNSFKRGS